jgi:two-component system response regulator FixJ
MSDARPIVHIVDDDAALRDSLDTLLSASGYRCVLHASAAAFVKSGARGGCALVDIRMPEMDGIALLQKLAADGIALPVIIMTGFADVALAVKAMKEGAVDFVEKPCPPDQLLDAVRKAVAQASVAVAAASEKKDAEKRLERLTDRERDVLALLVAGDPNKIIAHKLGISPRTVEIHRSRLMEKTQAGSLADLVRLSMAANPAGPATKS